jgi:hypothetical protein
MLKSDRVRSAGRGGLSARHAPHTPPGGRIQRFEVGFRHSGWSRVRSSTFVTCWGVKAQSKITGAGVNLTSHANNVSGVKNHPLVLSKSHPGTPQIIMIARGISHHAALRTLQNATLDVRSLTA